MPGTTNNTHPHDHPRPHLLKGPIDTEAHIHQSLDGLFPGSLQGKPAQVTTRTYPQPPRSEGHPPVSLNPARRALSHVLVDLGHGYSLPMNATAAAPLLCNTGFTSHNGFHSIAKDNLHPFLCFLTNQIVALLGQCEKLLVLADGLPTAQPPFVQLGDTQGLCRDA